MPIYLVAYDLNEEIERPDITKEVHKTDYVKLSESAYAIDTQETPEMVFVRFRQYLDNNDNLYVIALRKPWDGQGPNDVIAWLRSRLPALGFASRNAR